jgi:chorismate synthase
MSSDQPAPNLTIRPFSALEEYEACADFQEEIWGVGFSERVSAAILMVANRIGGLAAGAFDDKGGIQGFVFGLTGVEGGDLVHWSDMLAVREGLRDQGLGTRLKHYQRDVLLNRGIGRMHWTFDPLQSRNAYVNFAKLGITSKEYIRDMYGDTGSPLHRGVGTDRLVAHWQMDSERVTGRISGEGVVPSPSDVQGLGRAVPARSGSSRPMPGDPNLTLEDPSVLISIPGEIDRVAKEDMKLAVAWRQATRAAFLHYFSRGYEATELISTGELSHYVLSRDPPQ